MARSGPSFARARLSLPTAACKIRSWCNRWLSLAPNVHSTATFVHDESLSCAIVLWPVVSNLYKLEVLFPSAGQDQAGSPSHSSVERWFLCRRGYLLSVARATIELQSEDLLFGLELDDIGRVRFRAHGHGYLTTDDKGRFWSGTKTARKWECFSLQEEAMEGPLSDCNLAVRGPVRVTLKAHNGKYLCACMPVVSARAEAPCCCEELLLDLIFPPLVPSKQHDAIKTVLETNQDVLRIAGDNITEYGQKTRNLGSNNSHLSHPTFCTIRTADGSRVLSAEPDGMVCTARLDQVRGLEMFTLQLEHCERVPKVSILPFQREGQTYAELPRYMSTEPSGTVLCNGLQSKKSEHFYLELASGSRVLIKSVMGGCLAADPDAPEEDTSSPVNGRGPTSDDSAPKRKLCSCVIRTTKEVENVGAWQLRYHGDSLYTLLAVPSPKDGADVYMFADSNGRILQSNEPAVHFPALTSLFEIKPVSSSVLKRAACAFHEGSVLDRSIAGFTIQTVRKINGKRRFLSVEPCGSVRAVRTVPTRWEVFHLIDVDAAAATAAPQNFVCLAAASRCEPAVGHTPGSRRQLGSTLGGQILRGPGFRGRQSIDSISSGPPRTAAESIQRAAGVTLHALELGQAVPHRTPASLQDLCSSYVCWNASEAVRLGTSHHVQLKNVKQGGLMKKRDSEAQGGANCEFMELVGVLSSLAKSGNTLSSSGIHSLIAYNSLTLPDDLLFKVFSLWRSRQHPQHSCKWWPSTFVPFSYNTGGPQGRPLPNNGRVFAHAGLQQAQRLNALDRSLWAGTTEGWHCSSCDSGGVLNMDPSVNPAHHRYLEVQYHAFSGAHQPSGVLWNAISFIGISIMTTAFFFQAKASAGRRSGRP